MTIQTQFEIGETVKINGLGGHPGIIIGFEQDGRNLWNIVQYWAEWHIVTVHLSDAEIRHG